jgi:hypothetical protein
MEQATTVTAGEIAFELARWYHDLAKICVQAAEQHMVLTEDSAQADMERALAINDVIRVRMATVQSVERAFRTEFPRLYIDHQVEQILGSCLEQAE